MTTAGGRGALAFQVRLDARVMITDPGIQGEKAETLIEQSLDGVMDELLELNAIDPRIDAALAERTVSFLVTVSDRDALAAANTASGLIRSAIHAAGGGTPDWPESASEAWSVQLVNVKSLEVDDSQLATA